MSLRFLLDGYNLIYAMKEIPAGSWQDKRAALLAFLKQHQPQGKNAMTVVFDSRDGSGRVSQVGGIPVIYTSGETADDKIIHMVQTSNNPRVMVVVSNDKGIRHLLKSSGAQFVSADAFLLKANRTKPSRASGGKAADDPEITEELRKKWLL